MSDIDRILHDPFNQGFLLEDSSDCHFGDISDYTLEKRLEFCKERGFYTIDVFFHLLHDLRIEAFNRRSEKYNKQSCISFLAQCRDNLTCFIRGISKKLNYYKKTDSSSEVVKLLTDLCKHELTYAGIEPYDFLKVELPAEKYIKE